MSSASFRSAIRKENCDAVIRVYDEAGNVIETYEPVREFNMMLSYVWGQRPCGCPRDDLRGTRGKIFVNSVD